MKPVFSIITALRADWEIILFGPDIHTVLKTLQKPMSPKESNGSVH